MTKEEHAKVLEQTQILRDIAHHLTEDGYSMKGRDIKLAALEIEAAIMRKEPQGWMPIETAPKTSKAILVYCAERKNTFTVTWARDEEYPWSGKWKHFVGDLLNAVPTHWMPLPPPPALLEKAR